jgi:hypothetical protein
MVQRFNDSTIQRFNDSTIQQNMAKEKSIGGYFELKFITSDLILNNLIFVIFLGFLATIYIANAHYAERNVREIQLMQKDIKEMRWYYMSLQAENMYKSKHSEMLESVKDLGLRPQSGQPKRIVVKK